MADTFVVQACSCSYTRVMDPPADMTDRIVLFATKTCPKCKLSAQLLEKAGVEFEKVYYEDDPDFALKYDTRQAPTLLSFENGEVTKYADITGVKEFIASLG